MNLPKNNKNLSKNLAMAMCIGALASIPYTAAAATITTPIDIHDSSGYTGDPITDDLDIDTSGSNDIAVSLKSGDDHNINTTIDLDLKGDVRIKSGSNYALYSYTTSSSNMSTININTFGENKLVQIVGNIKSETVRNSSSMPPFSAIINLSLTNSDSYFSGDMQAVTIDNDQGFGSINGASSVHLNLSNGATWYPANTNSYTLGFYDDTTNQYRQWDDGIFVKSDGGVIDIYHSQPGQARANADSADRVFELKNIDDYNSGANSNIVFRIGTDVANGKADRIELSGSATGTMPNGTHEIQVVADPSFTTNSDVKIDASGKNIIVAKVDGTYLTDANTSFVGGTYEKAGINAGLGTADITTKLKHDTGSNEWTLEGTEIKVNYGDKGPALLMAEVAAAGAQSVSAAWRADNNDLMRRMGDLRNGDGDYGAWGKIYGGEIETRQGTGSKLNYRAVQVGFDRQIKLNQGKLITGVALSHLSGDGKSTVGNSDLTSTMFGLYGSYVGDKGHFADLIVKYGRMNNEIAYTDGANKYSGEYGSNGLSVTAEYGYRYQLKNNMYMEPQVELSYGSIGSSSYTMKMNSALGATVHNDAFKSLIGRIGFTLGQQKQKNNIYLKLALAHEFQGAVKLNANYNGIQAGSNIDGKSTWLEYGIGFNSMVGKNTNLYGEIERSTGSVVRTNWRAHMGLRYSF